MNGKARVHIYVSGRVQGVFFRQNTQEKAKILGITGWVRNLADGRVEAVFEGEKEKVQDLIEWAKRGPIGAKVTELKIEWQEYQGEFKDFEIRYDF
ncbi:MAG: acylphosphatase [Patescibacteria group bacterium]|nr:acylphosphatase [Patescibacteria group bacterium]